MNREQIVDRLARRGVWLDERYLEIVESVIREAEAAARAEEREGCAKVCDGMAGTEANPETLAEMIRARGETT